MNNHPFYSNDALVKMVTDQLVDHGVEILQIWKHGQTDREHCEWLLRQAIFGPGACVLDIACGIGAVAKWMQALRPDLRFSLQNNSLSQLNRCPPSAKWLGDMTALENVTYTKFDAAMVCYAMGHVSDLPTFFTNVARVLKPGGELFVYDILALPGFSQWMRNVLHYETYPVEALVKASGSMLLTHDYELNQKEFNVKEFERVCGTAIAVEVQVKTKPVAYKFVKQSTQTLYTEQS